MSLRRIARTATIVLTLSTAPVASQDKAPGEPPAAPAQPFAADADDAAGEEATGEDSQSDETLGTLRIECDRDCMVTVGLDPVQALAAGDVLTVEVEPGAIRVQAYLPETGEAKTFEDVTVEAGGRQRVRLKMTKALADLRKIEARDRTFRDPETRLMWPIRDNGVDLDWQEAADHCDGLEHGGWQDWRLPTLAELEGIERMWSLRAYKTADPITLSSCCAWSADRIDEENAWNFNYRFRRAFPGHLRYSLDLRALCVRDGSDEIPENTRKNRRLAKREAKEKQREKLRRQTEKAAAEAAAKEAEKAADDDPGGGAIER